MSIDFRTIHLSSPADSTFSFRQNFASNSTSQFSNYLSGSSDTSSSLRQNAQERQYRCIHSPAGATFLHRSCNIHNAALIRGLRTPYPQQAIPRPPLRPHRLPRRSCPIWKASIVFAASSLLPPPPSHHRVQNRPHRLLPPPYPSPLQARSPLPPPFHAIHLRGARPRGEVRQGSEPRAPR